MGDRAKRVTEYAAVSGPAAPRPQPTNVHQRMSATEEPRPTVSSWTLREVTTEERPFIRRLASPQQQQMVRALQCTHGNSHVQRLLRESESTLRHDESKTTIKPARDLAALPVQRLWGFSWPSSAEEETAPTTEPDKDHFLHLCGEANTAIDNAYTAADRWLMDLAIGYGRAWKAHTDTLKAQAEADRQAAAKETLWGGLILGAALHFVSGGVDGIIGAAMTRKRAGAFLADGVKNLAKYALKPAKGGGPADDASGMTIFPTDPLEWQSHVVGAVRSERLVVGEMLEGWQHAVNNDDPSFSRDFDPVQAVKNALTIQGKNLSELGKVDVDKEAENMEKGMWMSWIETYGFIQREEPARVDPEQTWYYPQHNVGKKITNRCKGLGLDITAYVESVRERTELEAIEHNRRVTPR